MGVGVGGVVGDGTGVLVGVGDGTLVGVGVGVPPTPDIKARSCAMLLTSGVPIPLAIS